MGERSFMSTPRLPALIIAMLCFVGCAANIDSEFVVARGKDVNTVISNDRLWFVTEKGDLVVREPNIDPISEEQSGREISEVSIYVAKGISDVKALSSPAYNSPFIYAIKNDGSLWQVEENSESESFSFTQVEGIENCVKACSGFEHTVVLTGDGHVYTWGANEAGQLGLGDTSSRDVPTMIEGLSDIVDIASGTRYCMALSRGGKVYTWGQNEQGQIGDGSIIEYEQATRTLTYQNREAPYEVEGLSNIIQIAAEGARSIALRDDGVVFDWGTYIRPIMLTSLLERSMMEEYYSITKPTKRKGLEQITQITSWGASSLAFSSNGKIFRWGLLIIVPDSRQEPPKKIASFPSPAKIVAGRITTVIAENGEIWQGNNGDDYYFDGKAVRIVGREEYAQLEKAAAE